MERKIAELKFFYTYLLQKNLSTKNSFLHNEALNMLISLKMAILLHDKKIDGFKLTNPNEALDEYIQHIVRVFIVETHFITECRVLKVLQKPKGKIENQLVQLFKKESIEVIEKWKDFFESFRMLRNCAHNNFICRESFIWKGRKMMKNKPIAVSFNEDVKFLLEELDKFLGIIDNKKTLSNRV